MADYSSWVRMPQMERDLSVIPYLRRRIAIWIRTPTGLVWHLQFAVEFAKRAVEHASDDRKAKFLNTLGVAQYRAGNWQETISVLEESLKLEPNKNAGCRDFFLAMALHKVGKVDESRHWYDKGVEGMTNGDPKNEDMQRIHDEASKTLGILNPKSPNEQRDKDSNEKGQLSRRPTRCTRHASTDRFSCPGYTTNRSIDDATSRGRRAKCRSPIKRTTFRRYIYVRKRVVCWCIPRVDELLGLSMQPIGNQ
jgi:hypothetical protein